MASERQQAYLEAMGIGVWTLRDPGQDVVPDPVNMPALKLGPGSGGILLICSIDTDSANRLANDISRVLGCVPVWAWPDDDTDSTQLTEAIENNLFTTVAIFGDELARQFFGDELPAHLNSAKLVLLPSIAQLHSQAQARKTLWSTICKSGMVSRV
jgi:hypothetical protein